MAAVVVMVAAAVVIVAAAVVLVAAVVVLAPAVMGGTGGGGGCGASNRQSVLWTRDSISKWRRGGRMQKYMMDIRPQGELVRHIFFCSL